METYSCTLNEEEWQNAQRNTFTYTLYNIQERCLVTLLSTASLLCLVTVLFAESHCKSAVLIRGSGNVFLYGIHV